MKRNIIEIDREKCNGCGDCVSACAEGAIQMVDGKAKVVKDEYCDGLGACLGDCPTGALKIVERDAPAYDPSAVEQHLAKTRGPEGLARFRAQHAEEHPPAGPPLVMLGGPRGGHGGQGGGCPGSRMRDLRPQAAAVVPTPATATGLPPKINASELSQWPIQLHLVPPTAPFFQDKELVIMSTCGPLASADAHWRFLRGRSLVIACPKLDRTEPYVDKLAMIFAHNRISTAYVVRMEVPCCAGLTRMAVQAHAQSRRTDLRLEEVTLGIDGSVQSQLPVAG